MCDDEKQGIWGNMQVFLLEGWNGGGVIYQTQEKQGGWVCKQDEFHFGHVEFGYLRYIWMGMHRWLVEILDLRCGQVKMCHWMISQGEIVEKGIVKGFEQ